MNVSTPFIARPVATTLLMVAIALAGAVSFGLLPVSPLPEVEFPTISVSASLPGASPETMAATVATPLERQFGRIAGVTEMTSTSGLGSAQVVLQFDLDRDIDAAARDVQAAINAARGQLPANLPNNPGYRKVNPADAPIMMLSITSDLVEPSKMYDVASSILQQKVSQVRGVGQVVVGGGALPAVRVEVEPEALSARGLSLEDVRQTLATSNANLAKGAIASGTRRWTIDATDQLLHASEYRPLVLSALNGDVLRLSDVAHVVDSVEDLRTGGFANGQPAVLILVFRQPGANIIDTVDGIRALMPELQASIPTSMTLAVMQDRTTTIRASVHDVEITLGISLGLVILVVYVFLRNARSTLIPSVAVPVSLVGTFGVMYLLGYTLDNLSLMAITIATGFVVDDAIVVVENITRHIEGGKSPMDAAIDGASEIGFTVVSISLSLIAVFIPILLMGGIVGRLFREFAVCLSVAILVSMVVSLTATPAMSARLLKAAAGDQPNRFGRLTEAAIAAVHGWYKSSLAWVLDHRALTLTVTLVTMVATGYLYMRIPKGFFPQQDTGRLTGSIQADEGSSFQAMQEKLTELAAIVRSDPGVQAVMAYAGGGGSQNSARMFVTLKDRPARKESATEIMARIRLKASQVSGALLVLQPVQDLRVGGRASAAQYQYTLQGESFETLDEWAPRVFAKLRTLRTLTDVSSDQQDKGLQTSVVIDRDTAARLGISTQLIDDTLYDAFGQRQVSTMFLPLNQYHVVMEVDPLLSQGPQGLDAIYVKASDGQPIPLSAVTRAGSSTAPLAVNHQSQFPAVTLSFNLPAGVALSDAVADINAAESQMGLPPDIHGSFQGTAQAYQSSLSSQPWLIAAAILTVYIVLGVLYESLVHPITILSTLPSAGLGALVALLITGTDLTIIALIGIILLIGIVKKNAILMIDFAVDAERTKGLTARDAIYQAALLRFRPITMTTMAALLGGLPLAIGLGTGSELRRPLGIAIVGGLTVSQMLTLYTTPVVYLYLDRLGIKRARQGVVALPPAPVAIGLLLAAAGLSSCSPSPAYTRPPVASPASFKETPAADSLLGAAWKAAEPQDDRIRAKWWETFNDTVLSQLEEKIGVSNQTVLQAEAEFRSARAALRALDAQYFPTIGVTASADATHASDNRRAGSVVGNSGVVTNGPGAGTIRDYQVHADLDYELDIWGRIRNSVRAGVGTVQASAADLQTIVLSMRAELATDYFQLRGIDAERRVLAATVTADERALQLTTNRYNQGVASGSDVAQAQAQLDSVRVQVIDLGVERATLEHAIAVLTGAPPSSLSVAEDTAEPAPPVVPLTMPSTLVERRPDVAAAERRAAAANAQIGVARAALFPTLTLTGSGGVDSSVLANLFSWPSRFWSLGASLAATLFDGGRRRALSDQAVANYDASVAVYRQSVLQALQDVEDSLATLRILADEASAQAAAVQSSERVLTLANNRYQGGIASYLEVITAQDAALLNERTAVDLLTRRMTASVLLVKALGGGWSVTDLPKPR